MEGLRPPSHHMCLRRRLQVRSGLRPPRLNHASLELTCLGEALRRGPVMTLQTGPLMPYRYALVDDMVRVAERNPPRNCTALGRACRMTS